LLFAIDAKCGIQDGFRYATDCKALRDSGVASSSHCTTDFSDASFDGGTAGFGDGEASGGLGGSSGASGEGADAGSGGNGDSGGGGCGGGCGGGGD
jgi:hypothetical protein